MVALMFSCFGISHMYAADTAVVCTFPDHAIYNLDGTVKVGCISQANWDASVQQQVNQNSVTDYLKVAVGQHLMTTWGIEDFCPSWFPPVGCVIKKSIFVRFI